MLGKLQGEHRDDAIWMLMDPAARLRRCLLVVALGSPLASAQGRTWRVGNDSADAPTIQAAVDSASSGDSILVSPGVYDENPLLPPAKWLAVIGIAGAQSTVIDGGFRGPVLTIKEGALIQGFTIRHGRYWYGAGIRFDGAATGHGTGDLVVRSNIIEQNYSGFVPDDGPGGGIFIAGFSPGKHLIEGNLIRNNSAGESGGGIFAEGESETDVRDNTIVGNSCGLSGAGIYISNGKVTGNLVIGNHAQYFGGGVQVAGYAEIHANTIYGNTVDALSVGAGIHVEFFAVITQNLIMGNSGPPGGRGAGVYLCNASAVLGCNDLWQNQIDSIVCGSSGTGDFSADPQFCAIDPMGSMSFLLQDDSPCLPGNHPQGVSCGIIGTQSAGCGADDVQQTTWTKWKSLFR